MAADEEKDMTRRLRRNVRLAVEQGLLRGDSGGRATFYESGLRNGWMTINQVRALENMPPVEGGDVPRMQMQNVPITEAGQQPALPAPAA